MSPPATTRVVKSAEERRTEILQASIHLFSKKGYDEASVQEIAESAGVGTGTVYLYFPSKEHVLFGIHEQFHRGLAERFVEQMSAFFESVESGAEIPPEELLDRIVDTLVEYSVQRKDVVEVIARYDHRLDDPQMDDQVERGFAEFMARAFEEGVRHDYLHVSDPEMAAYVLTRATMETIGHSIAFGEPPLERLVPQVKELLLKSLAPLPEH